MFPPHVIPYFLTTKLKKNRTKIKIEDGRIRIYKKQWKIVGDPYSTSSKFRIPVNSISRIYIEGNNRGSSSIFPSQVINWIRIKRKSRRIRPKEVSDQLPCQVIKWIRNLIKQIGELDPDPHPRRHEARVTGLPATREFPPDSHARDMFSFCQNR